MEELGIIRYLLFMACPLLNNYNSNRTVLNKKGLHRFSAIQKLFPKIFHKVLTNQLRELEEDGIVHRQVYHEVVPINTHSPRWARACCRSF